MVMDSGDMLKQLLEKFANEGKFIHEELKIIEEQITELNIRLGECEERKIKVAVDRERVLAMMDRYLHGKFEPPPELAEKFAQAASALALEKAAKAEAAELSGNGEDKAKSSESAPGPKFNVAVSSKRASAKKDESDAAESSAKEQAKAAKADAAKAETAKADAAKAEKAEKAAKAEAEKAEKAAKAEAEKAEAEKLAKAEAEKAEAAKAEAEKAEAEKAAKAEAEKAEQEKVEAEKAAKAEAERIEAENNAKAEAEKAEQERIKAEEEAAATAAAAAASAAAILANDPFQSAALQSVSNASPPPMPGPASDSLINALSSPLESSWGEAEASWPAETTEDQTAWTAETEDWTKQEAGSAEWVQGDNLQATTAYEGSQAGTAEEYTQTEWVKEDEFQQELVNQDPSLAAAYADPQQTDQTDPNQQHAAAASTDVLAGSESSAEPGEEGDSETVKSINDALRSLFR